MNTTNRQKTTGFLMFAVGLLYFGAFVLPNSYGASTDEILVDSSTDEFVTYPNVVRILTPGKTFNETRANLFLYEDYHYGYPFYALSALAVLPSRLIYGIRFTDHMQLNLLLLRQIISVLPMILAAGLLVFYKYVTERSTGKKNKNLKTKTAITNCWIFCGAIWPPGKPMCWAGKGASPPGAGTGRNLP